MSENNKPYPSNPTKFILLYAFKNKVLFSIIFSLGALEIISAKLAPFFFSRITGLFGKDVDFNSIKEKIFLFLGLFVLAEICQRIFYYFNRKASEVKLEPKMYQDVYEDLFLYLHGHSVEYFANNMAGKLADKIKGAAEASAAICVSSTFFIKWIFDFCVMIFMFAMANVYFGLLYATTLLIVLAITLRLSKRINIKRKDYADYRTKLSGDFIDALQNNFFVKIFNGKKHEEQRVCSSMQIEKNKLKSYVSERMLQNYGQHFVLNIINISFLFYAVVLWKNHELKTEDLVFIFMLTQYATQTIGSIYSFIVNLSNRMADLTAHLDVFSTPHEIVDSSDKKLKIKNASIEFDNISFGYNNKTKVFNNFSLKIPAGQKLGIVGASGCGKTTLISLLQRFYDIEKGKILIDGKNIKSTTQDSLCQNISCVSQQNQLFQRSIKENIAYGRPSASMDEIVKSAKDAYADNFIKKLENGYDSVLGGDKKLSGGQMQRIAIARSLLENAPILILDEATSALDSQSESYIQKAISKLIKNKTVIAVAHRLSTLKNMDRIIVIDNGDIIEDGNINDLLKQKGKFFEFWNMQKLVEEKEHDNKN